jgi:outer membrane protein OmpA-like peptidoglycan-associated protein
MSDFYVPGVWAERYGRLSKAERDDVDQEVDRQFRARKGVSRKLDPKKDKDLVVQWLRIRDEVMQRMGGKGAPNRSKTGEGLAMWLPSGMQNMAYLLLYNYDIGSSELKPLHVKALDGAMKLYVRAQVSVFIGVLGHASRTGGDAFDNPGLSSRRAAIVDQYLRKFAGSTVSFFRPGGTGSKEEVSKDPNYREVWPYLESIDEDERDRSVVVTIKWQDPGAIDALNEPAVDWNKAFDEAAPWAALNYVSTMGLMIASDNLSPIVVKGVSSPWNPWTGWPTSWTTGNVDADKVMQVMGKMMIDELEKAARKKNLKITRDEIIEHYQTWLKNPKNKWVNP